MLILDALSLNAEKPQYPVTPCVLIICQPSLFGVQQVALMMRDNAKPGGSMETQIMCLLTNRGDALDATDIAGLIDEDAPAVWEALERLYFSSKLEKKNGYRPIYRVPGANDGKLSLPN